MQKLEIIPIIPRFFPRENGCRVCKKNLVEEIHYESSHPNHPIGGDIYCPYCSILYKHQKTDGKILEQYLNRIKASQSVTMLQLKEDFIAAQFEDSYFHPGDISKDTILYSPITPYSQAEVYQKYRDGIRKLKLGLTKEKDGSYLNHNSIRMYKQENWEEVPALYVALDKRDVFEELLLKKDKDFVRRRMIRIPICLLNFPEECYSDSSRKVLNSNFVAHI